MMKIIAKYSAVLLAFFTILNLSLVIFFNREKFLSKYDHKRMGEIYSQSQYVKGPAATVGIGDDGLFAVAGYYLLFQGGDPTRIHFESPPAGEYLIGLSIFLFKNERVISIFYGLLFLIFIYKLSVILFKRKIIGLFASFLVSLDPFFHAHLISNLLDLPQALFVLLGLYYFIKGLKESSLNFFLSSIFFGFSVSVKFFPGIIFFFIVLLLWLIIEKIDRRKKTTMMISLILIPLIYVLSYFMFFYYHPSFKEFINFHKWMIRWRLGNPTVFGNIFFSILIGKYKSWWQTGLWLTNHDWSFLSPAIFLGGFFSVLISELRKIVYFRYLYIISISFLLYVAFGTTGVHKYIYPVYSLMVIFTSYSFFYLIKLLKID